jgi:hypothetical protein
MRRRAESARVESLLDGDCAAVALTPAVAASEMKATNNPGRM